MKNIVLTNKNLEDIALVLNYLLDSEIKSYEEYCASLIDGDYDVILTKNFYNKPEVKHIYAYTRRVKDAIEINND